MTESHIDINELTIDELIALNHRVVERIKFLEKAQAHWDMTAFNIGEKVSFESSKGIQFGRLVKYNQKTVNVITEDNVQWRIPPYLLRKIKDVAPALKKNTKNNRKKKKKRLKKK